MGKMTFKELLRKDEGTVYMVKKNNPSGLTECRVMLMTSDRYRDMFNPWWFRHEYTYVLCRISANKRLNRPAQVEFNACIGEVCLRAEVELDNDCLDYGRYLFFLDKDRAYDYVINSLKQRKLSLNASIIKLTKQKFNIT